MDRASEGRGSSLTLGKNIMRKLVPLVFLLLFSGCAKSTSLRGFNELTEVATTLFRNNTEELGYTIITEGGGSSATSGSMKYRVYERKIDYGAVKSSAFSRIEESIQNKGFRIHGRSSYGDTARTWEFDGLGISGVLRVDFTESKMGESATIIFVATRKNENGA